MNSDVVGTIKYTSTLDAKGVMGGLDDLDKQVSKTAQNTNKHFDGMERGANRVMSAIGTAIKVGMTSTLAAVGATTASSLKNFADYEQLIGGVDTLFKGSSATIQRYADDAFKTAGLSANEYMSTVTSFSASLLQGLGGDTKKAAEYADMAVKDMADNANKMGTDMSLIQHAYQGFAKDSYIMLDNLKLGYGGTQTEMARLINDSGVMGGAFKATAENLSAIPFDKVVEAIHKTQVEMGITGTTAKEASSTIAGSFRSTTSAWNDFTARLATGNREEIQRTFDNLMESSGNLARNVGGVLGNVFKALPQPIQDVANKAVELGRQVGDYLGPKLSGLWSVVSEKLIPALSTFWKQYLEPLMPVLGVMFVGAIGAALDIMNLLAGSISWVITEINNGNPILLGLIGTLGVLAGAGALGAVIGVLNVLSLTTIPAVIQSFSVMAAAIMANPIVMPAIAIGAALAAIATVWTEYNRMMDAVSSAEASYNSMKSADAKIRSQMVGILNDSVSSSARKEHARKLINEIDSRFTGGPVSANSPYLVGENPDGSINRTTELFVPKTSGSIINSRDLQKMITGKSGNSYNVTNNYVVNNQADAEIISRKQAYAMGAV